MKTYYYDLDEARFVDSAGERIPRCVPELFYQEHAEWKIVLRDGGNAPADLSRIAAWGAAVADDFRADTAPMCRTPNEGIAADTNSGEVTVALDCATEEFLACVAGASEKSARFELYGLDESGRRLINVAFEIRARMTLDPDPGIDVHTPDTVATKAFVSAYVHQSGAITSGAEFVTRIGGYTLSCTSGGFAVSGGGVQFQVSSGGIVASGASGASVVLSGGTAKLMNEYDGIHQFIAVHSAGIDISASDPLRNINLNCHPGSVCVNSRPVLTELVASTDSEATSASIAVLSGGTAYTFTQPLTSLSVASMESSMKETWLRFTVASGGSVSINDSGFEWFGGRPSAYEGGSSYSIGVWNGMMVCGELED
jgi:hypothetical protein